MNSTIVLLYLISYPPFTMNRSFAVRYMRLSKHSSNVFVPDAWFVIGKLRDIVMPLCVFGFLLPNSHTSFALLSLPSKPTLRLSHRSAASPNHPDVIRGCQ